MSTESPDRPQIGGHANDARLVTTTFEHVKNPEPLNMRDWTWGEFVEFVEGQGHERVDDKSATYLFGNYKLKDGTKSANANVEAVFAWALDLDKLSQQEVDDVLTRLLEDDLAFLCYSTHSHSVAKPKLRVVGPLARPVAGKDWRPVWRAIVDRYSPGADEACKDPRRLLYWPSAKPGAPVELYSNPGRALDVDSLELPRAAQPSGLPDLDAPELRGSSPPRCPTGVSPLQYAETLCKTMPAAIQGQQGSVALLRVARALVWGLELDAAQAASLIAELYNPRCVPQWSDVEIAHKVTDAASPDGAPHAKGSLLPAEPDSHDHLPLIVQRERRYWLRLPSSDDYAARVKESDLVRKVKDLYGENELATWNDSENPRIGKATIEDRSRVVDHVVTCYHEPRTTFDPTTNTIFEGLRIDPKLTPRENPHVAAWLAQLAGDDLAALQMWIAGCRQDLLKAPAPALGLVGPKEAGKSLIAAGLARAYGDPCAPVSAMVLVSQFNGDLCRCPVVLADEKLPKDMTGEDFREKVAQRAHSVELKGKERHTLNGSIRFVVAANNIDRVLGLTGEKCDDDLQAIADRWRLIQVTPERAAGCTAALDPLKLRDGSNVDLATIAEHFLWLQATVEPHRGRFVGSPPDTKILNALRRSEADRTLPELFDLLVSGLAATGPARGQHGEPPIPRQGDPKPDARNHFPMFWAGERFYVRPAVLAALLGETAKAVGAALRPFMVGKRVSVSVGGGNVWAYALDVDRLRQVRDAA